MRNNIFAIFSILFFVGCGDTCNPDCTYECPGASDGGDGTCQVTEVSVEADLSSASEQSIAKQGIVIIARDGQTIADRFNEMIDDAKAGDTFIVPNGEYSDQVFLFSGNGAEGNPITFQAETPGKVLFTGQSRIVIKGKYLAVSGFTFDQVWLENNNVVRFVEAEHCTLSDCVFIECGNKEKVWNNIVRIENNSHYNDVLRCYMVGSLAGGVHIKFDPGYPDSTHNTLAYNYFKDFEHFTNGTQAITVGTAYTHWPINAYLTAEYNLLENVSGDVEAISSKSSSNTFRYNTLKNCGGNLVLRGGSSATVEGNYLLNVGIRAHGENHKIINNYIDGASVGIDLWTGTGYGDATDKYQGVKDCLVGYNTIVNTSKIGIYLGRNYELESGGYVYDAHPLDCVFVNNILTSNSGELVNNKFSENISWVTNIVWPSSSAKTGTGILENVLTIIDPELTQNSHGIWSINSDSPAVENATPIAGIIYDIARNKRDDTKPDVGSREYVAAYSSDDFSPLLPEDVGPSWMEGDVNNILRIESPQPVEY